MKNNNQHIESLLNLFMQGETTLEQERELCQFFATSPSIPGEWKPYKEMMAYFDEGMPINKIKKTRRNMTRAIWGVIAAAAVAAIFVIVGSNQSPPSLKVTPPAPPVIIADKDICKTSETIVASVVKEPKPIIVKAEKKTIHSKPSQLKTSSVPQKVEHKAFTSSKVLRDTLEIEREKGEVEQAQQELMADKYIIEQERQDIIDEHYASRAQAYQAQQELNNETPQFIQVVFK